MQPVWWGGGVTEDETGVVETGNGIEAPSSQTHAAPKAYRQLAGSSGNHSFPLVSSSTCSSSHCSF